MAELYAFTFCRWAIALTFAVSAIGKASALATFRVAITDFGVLPAHWSGRLATLTLTAESLVVLLMAVGGRPAAVGFVLALVLLAAFSALLVRALRRRDGLSCNCFGRSERPISGYDVVRNAALGLCCVAGLWAGAPAGRPALGLVLVLALMAATLTALLTNLADVVELLRRPYVVD